MKKLMMLVVIGVGVFLGGCGMVDSFSERTRRIRNIQEIHARMVVDDIDEIFFFHRSSRLSRWKPVIGY